ncbi:MAG: AraC family transcriptional regulator [Spirochaetaceae bacterium]|nr:AraC family transcriptional regulator [Spirochaetaceae bacterium]
MELKDKKRTIEELLTKQLFFQREYSIYHLEYEKEMSFYKAVQKGDIELVKKLMLPLKNEKLGSLSKNSLQNLKYHLVVLISMLTRFSIEGGMNPESAYTLSDIYIQQVDLLSSEEETEKIHEKIIFDYTNRMAKIHKTIGLSKKVIKAMDYIYDNIQSKIRISDIAKKIDINPNYLCELFKKETGISINNFIKKKKIQAAEKLLIYEDFSVAELADILGFASSSHFIETFKAETGLTPKTYKEKGQFTNL